MLIDKHVRFASSLTRKTPWIEWEQSPKTTTTTTTTTWIRRESTWQFHSSVHTWIQFTLMNHNAPLLCVCVLLLLNHTHHPHSRSCETHSHHHIRWTVSYWCDGSRFSSAIESKSIPNNARLLHNTDLLFIFVLVFFFRFHLLALYDKHENCVQTLPNYVSHTIYVQLNVCNVCVVGWNRAEKNVYNTEKITK